MSIKDQRIDKDYGWFDKGGIKSLFCTTDNIFLFVGGSNGQLLQIEMLNRKVIKDYGTVLDSNIFAMAGTDCYGTLWLVDESGAMKVLDVREQRWIGNFSVSDKAVYCVCLINK